MIREHLFATSVYEYKWKDVDDMNSGLVDYIMSMPKDNAYSMVCGTHTDYNLFSDKALQNSYVLEFYKRISSLVIEWGNDNIDQNFKDNFGNRVKMTPWAMIYGPNDYSKIHNHSGVELSMTYYPLVPEMVGNNGSLEILDPRPAAANDYYQTQKNGDRIFYKPKQGGGYMFPGWLQHGTSPSKNAGDKLRICIAINVKIQNYV